MRQKSLALERRASPSGGSKHSNEHFFNVVDTGVPRLQNAE